MWRSNDEGRVLQGRIFATHISVPGGGPALTTVSIT